MTALQKEEDLFPSITKHALRRTRERYGDVYEKTKREGQTLKEWITERAIKALIGIFQMQPIHVKHNGINFVYQWDSGRPVLVTVKPLKDEKYKKITSNKSEHEDDRVGKGFLYE